jgi:hypothetical protein
MKKTAVEWFIKQLDIKLDGWNNDVIKQAKEMEKEQIINAVHYTCSSMTHYDLPCGEQYYNATYKNTEE